MEYRPTAPCGSTRRSGADGSPPGNAAASVSVVDLRASKIGKVRIVYFPDADVPEELRAQVFGLHDLVWPRDTPTGSDPTHDPALRPTSVLIIDGDRVVATLDILSKQVTHRGRSYAVSGLSSVTTDPAYRGHGHGRGLVEAARELTAAAGADLGIFSCDPPLQQFYERAGWQRLVGTVLIGGTPEAPLRSDQLGKVTMGAFLSPRAKRDARTFLGCRLELYPGEIDKLW
jgi:aminoglycoside 2'-N-acetyltransferase I